MRGDQLIPSHYKNLVVRFMNHNGALFNLDNLYLTFKIVFHYDHLVSIKLFRGWKVEKKIETKNLEASLSDILTDYFSDFSD